MARTADKELYLKENRYDSPKEYFKFVGSKALPFLNPGDSVIDHGCAAGEFAFYLYKQAPQLKIHGFDLVPELISKAQAVLPEVQFSVGNVLDPVLHQNDSWNAQFLQGVHSIFDDLDPLLANLVNWAAPGGKIWIFGNFNPYSVDVLIKYKSSDKSQLDWEAGWNKFSLKTVENLLKMHAVEKPVVHSFQMPFDLHEQDDPARSWTFIDKEGKRLFRNGLGLIIDLYLIEITKKK